MKLNAVDISKVAQHLVEQTSCLPQVEPGNCLTCGSSFDFKTADSMLNKAEIHIRRYMITLFHFELQNLD